MPYVISACRQTEKRQEAHEMRQKPFRLKERMSFVVPVFWFWKDGRSIDKCLAQNKIKTEQCPRTNTGKINQGKNHAALLSFV